MIGKMNQTRKIFYLPISSFYLLFFLNQTKPKRLLKKKKKKTIESKLNTPPECKQ